MTIFINPLTSNFNLLIKFCKKHNMVQSIYGCTQIYHIAGNFDGGKF